MTFKLGHSTQELSTETDKFWFYTTCCSLNLFFLILQYAPYLYGQRGVLGIFFFAYFKSYSPFGATLTKSSNYRLDKSKKHNSDYSYFHTNTNLKVLNIAANSRQLSFYASNYYSTSSSLSPVKTYRNTRAAV